MARKWHGIVWAAVVILASGALVPEATWAATQTLAISGQSAPGTGGGTFWDLYTPALNASGQAAFQASLFDTSDGSMQGIFRGDGSTLTAIARQMGSAPGTGGGMFSYFGDDPALNAFGWAAFLAWLFDTSDGSSYGIFRGNGSTTTAIARDKWAAPGTGGGTFASFGTPALNASGLAAFWAYLTGTSDGSTEGIFVSSGSPKAIAREKGAAPGTGGGTFLYFADPAINASGQAAFYAALTGTSDGSTVGIFRGSGSTPTAIARHKWAAPGTGGGTFSSSFSTPALNASGQAAFRASLTGTTDGSTGGIFRGDGSTTTAIAREKWAAPGTGGGTFSGFGDPALNASGQAAFLAALTGTSDGSGQGIFRGDGSTTVAIARQKWAVPWTGGGTFSSLGNPALNASGQVAFYAELTGTVGGNDTGIFLADDQERIVAVREGDALAGSTVITVSFLGGQDRGGRSGLNDYGQVAYQANLADWRMGLFLYTPDLHWRAAAGGNWDTAANWTVGLAPASVHPVLIDPLSSLTVTGPAYAKTVKSLTVGAKTYGQTATLNLASATGALTVTGAAAVQTAGCINVSAGTFTAGSLTNAGTFFVDMAGAASLGSLLNTGAATVNGAATVSGAAENDGTLTVQSGGTLTATGGLTNLGNLTLEGATLAGGTVTNDYGAWMSARGTITGALTNNGSLSLAGLLTTSGLVTNFGVLSACTTQNVRQNGGLDNYGTIALSGGAVSGSGTVTNYGTIALSGGAVSGSGAMTNKPGAIIRGYGALSAAFANQGQIQIGATDTLTVSQAFTNSGVITLGGVQGTLAGGTITNTGTIRGLGQVANTVSNDAGGTIRAEGGTLILAAATNAAGARIEVPDGAGILLSQGLSTNSGTISLLGGAFDTNGFAMTNAGTVTGYGTLRTGGLTNNTGKNIGTGGGNLDVLGPVTNDGTVTTQAGCTTTFYNFVNGDGSFPGTGTVVFLDGFSPGHSPGRVEFGGDVVLAPEGRLLMEIGGARPGEEYDALDVAGTLALGGTLDVSLLSGFQPCGGQVFDLLDWGGVTGAFDTVDLPMLREGLAWDTSDLYTSGTLTVMPEPATLALIGLGTLGALFRRRRV